MRCRVVFVVLAVLAIWATNTAVAAAAGELTFVEPENVAATYKQGRTNEVSVWLENGSTQEVTPRFTTVLEGKGGEAAAAEVEVVGEGAAGGRAAASIAAGQVARYRLVFVDPSKSNGQLVAGAPGLKPATLPLSLAPNLSSTRGINAALIIPAIFAFALWVVALDIAIIPAVFGCGIGFLGKMGPLAGLGFRAELDFSKSFASTLTGVGALLGTIIGAGVLPTETVAISRGGFVGLNLTFGVAIVVAGALSGALLRPKVFDNTKEQTKEWKVEGYLWAFIASTLITLWAVFGELYAIWLLIGELHATEGFSEVGLWALRVILIGGALAMAPYTVTKLKMAIRAPDEGARTATDSDSDVAPAVPPTIAVL